MNIINEKQAKYKCIHIHNTNKHTRKKMSVISVCTTGFVDGLNENMKEESRALVNYSSHLWTLEPNGCSWAWISKELLCIYILLKRHKDLTLFRLICPINRIQLPDGRAFKMCVVGINSLWPGRVTCAEIINKQWALATSEQYCTCGHKNDQTIRL